MPNVVFVAPFFLDTTLRFVEAAANLPGVRLGLVSQDPEDKLPRGLHRKLAGHYRVDNGLSARSLLDGVRAMQRHFGSVDRLLGTLEELQVPLGELRDELRISGMGAEAAYNFRDKARMKTVLSRANLPCARHRLATEPQAAMDFAREVGFPLIVKPPAGAGARSTFKLEDIKDLVESLEALPPSRQRPTLYEEFVVGEEHSFDSVCIDGRVVWYSVNDYYPGPIEVLKNPWIQWCVVSPRDVTQPRYEGIRQVAGPALRSLGLVNGLSHMEWFKRHNGSVAISEVGARPPGAQFTTLISYAHDYDLNRAWASLMVYDKFDMPPRQFASGCAYLRAQGHGRRIKAVKGLEAAQREVAGLVMEAKLPRPGATPASTYEGDGFVIVRHPDTAVVERALSSIVKNVHVELG